MEIANGESRDVWVYAEQRDAKLRPVSFELLGAGRKLADALGQQLVAVLLGNDMHAAAQTLIGYGADRVHYLDGPDFISFTAEPYAGALTELAQTERPAVFLAGATAIGRSLFPRVAANLRTGLTADCTGLEIDPENGLLLGTRPAYGGNVLATIICPQKRPQMATVRHRVMKALEYEPGRVGEVVHATVPASRFPSRARVLSTVTELDQAVDIADADIVVTGGRGMGSKDNFQLVRELAKATGGAVGASRGAVDAGWVSYTHQVGQTGKTVCPRVYFALGVSGAVQHLVGMQTSDVIVAINSDPEAEIFKVATYGIVGDVNDVVPELIALLLTGNRPESG